MNMNLTILIREMGLNLEELDNFVEQNRIFKNTPLILEKNENSALIAVSKPPTQEFFERVFDPLGPFWDIYSELGFATRPLNTKYIAFINGRMYFLRNIEKKFMNSIGPEKSFDLDTEKWQLKEKIIPSASNFLLMLSALFDALKQYESIIKLSFMANEAIKKFEDFREKTIIFYKNHSSKSNIENPLKMARKSLEGAVHSMTYTNLAMLCYTLRVKLRKSESIEECESQILRNLIERGDWNSIKKSFGFYSFSPYDISRPRFREDITGLERYGSPEPPTNYSLKWRENAKYLCARYLDIERIAFKKLGELTGLGDLIFYCRTTELDELDTGNLEKLALKRKSLFDRYEKIELPQKIIYFNGNVYIPHEDIEETTIIQAQSVSSKRIVVGPAFNVNTMDDYEKFPDGSIIISKTLDPNLTILYKMAIAVVSESGGHLAHAAVIAREMDLPCLVRANFPIQIKDGQYLKVNGGTGEIEILKDKKFKLCNS
ncbi:MAG TPA: hypothetical protein EYP86_02940 [Candidatus Altiarchaeales archaeon]|nr:hypothetical protein [Candidatus Altiarchaeales archaeon]